MIWYLILLVEALALVVIIEVVPSQLIKNQIKLLTKPLSYPLALSPLCIWPCTIVGLLGLMKGAAPTTPVKVFTVIPLLLLVIIGIMHQLRVRRYRKIMRRRTRP